MAQASPAMLQARATKNKATGPRRLKPWEADSAIAQTASNAPETIKTVHATTRLRSQAVLSWCGYGSLVRGPAHRVPRRFYGGGRTLTMVAPHPSPGRVVAGGAGPATALATGRGACAPPVRSSRAAARRRGDAREDRDRARRDGRSGDAG